MNSTRKVGGPRFLGTQPLKLRWVSFLGTSPPWKILKKGLKLNFSWKFFQNIFLNHKLEFWETKNIFQGGQVPGHPTKEPGTSNLSSTANCKCHHLIYNIIILGILPVGGNWLCWSSPLPYYPHQTIVTRKKTKFLKHNVHQEWKIYITDLVNM